MRELCIGAGPTPRKVLHGPDDDHFHELVTVDVDPDAHPTVVFDLNEIVLPFEDDSFDEIHAYEILEHLGAQGDWAFFFAQFREFERIIKPGGRMFISVPLPDSEWAWGDPGHVRVLPWQAFQYLDPEMYGHGDARTQFYKRYLDKGWWIYQQFQQGTQQYVILETYKCVES